MTSKIWIVNKFYRDYYEGDSTKWSYRAAFITEDAAKECIDKMKDEIEKMISIWKDCRKFDYCPDDDMERTEPEQKFSYMTNHNPWYFSDEDEIREYYKGFMYYEEVPLYG